MKTEYRLIKETSYIRFTNLVNAALQDGFCLHGDTQIIITPWSGDKMTRETIDHYQAMVQVTT